MLTLRGVRKFLQRKRNFVTSLSVFRGSELAYGGEAPLKKYVDNDTKFMKIPFSCDWRACFPNRTRMTQIESIH